MIKSKYDRSAAAKKAWATMRAKGIKPGFNRKKVFAEVDASNRRFSGYSKQKRRTLATRARDLSWVDDAISIKKQLVKLYRELESITASIA